ncbi:MAG: ribonuclease H family protein [Eubacterium sp.]|nr:ribonuclease H family protein [Eubacterium sp.]
MAKKYYAVKVGLTTGIFETWEECKASVDGYPGALYKSFKTLAEAHAYMGWSGQQLNLFDVADSMDELVNEKIDYTPEQNEEAPDMEKPFSNSLTAVAYVDGSFNTSTGVFGYGVVMFHNGQELHFNDSFDDEEMASMRNVAGEIYGSMAAMEYAIKNNVKNLTIFYDYMGISKWCTGEWKTNKKGTILYKKYYEQAKKKVQISFEKVKGHSGDKYNDLADRLAKDACEIN